ncbi:hypothetical protein KQI41_05225 [Tissierella pigra]|nr:ABC transporter substrate-binding protein [Tissierella pigra]MBU5425809.1 hypothetical protein [Tissierella pigra]
MMKKSIIFLLVLTLVLSAFLAGCKPKDTAVDTPPDVADDSNKDEPKEVYPGSERGNVLTVGGTSPDGIFNPITYSATYDYYMIELMFNSLLNVEKNGALTTEGALVKDYTVSDDGLKYTFNLREGIKWHDGVEVTADDVVFTFNAIFAPDYKGRGYTLVMQDIVGAKDVKAGNAETAEGVKALDKYTVEITVEQAKATTLRGLAIMPIPKHYYGDKTADEMAALNRDPIGNGAFKLKKYEAEQYVELEANPDYWQGAPKLDGIIWKVIANVDELSEFEIGAIDAVNFEGSIENYETIEGDAYKHGTLINNMNNGYAYAGFNFTNPIFQDKNVRQALAYGLDRKGFIESFFGDKGGFVAHTPISPVSWAYPDESQLNLYEYNKDKAIELLEASGWKLGADGIREKDGKKLAFKWHSYQEALWSTKITALAAEQWKQIGVDCEIVLMDFNSLSTLISDPGNKDKYDMWNMAWGLGADPDMSGVYSKTLFPPGNNRGYFDNEKIEQLMKDGVVEFDETKRKEIYQELAREFNEELPYLYIYIRMSPWLVNKRVKNFNPSEFIYWSRDGHLIEIAQ